MSDFMLMNKLYNSVFLHKYVYISIHTLYMEFSLLISAFYVKKSL